MGIFQDIGKGKIGKALDKLGNGTIDAITKTGSAVQKQAALPWNALSGLTSSPLFMPMLLVGGVVVLMVLSKR
jgi:hypothetical protein